MVGKPTINAKPQAFNQTDTILFTKPMLKTMMTKDIIHDMNIAIKNEKTIF